MEDYIIEEKFNKLMESVSYDNVIIQDIMEAEGLKVESKDSWNFCILYERSIYSIRCGYICCN